MKRNNKTIKKMAYNDNSKHGRSVGFGFATSCMYHRNNTCMCGGGELNKTKTSVVETKKSYIEV